MSEIGRQLQVGQWDGSRWSPLGAGLDNTVRVLTSYQGDLVAGGHFKRSGETETPHVARWDGTSWHPLGGGTNKIVRALWNWEGDLIAGGLFTRAGGIRATYLAAWDGEAWGNPFVGPLADPKEPGEQADP